VLKKIRAWIRKYADDLFFITGGLAILIGTYQIQPIAAWFVGGAECLMAGFLLAWSRKK
jgi:hypothetical protein